MRTDPTSLFRLDGAKALVTGAGRGIGRSIAIGLAGAGADVCLASRTTAELDEVADQASRYGHRTLTIRADLLDDESIDALVSKAHRELGTVDILINNAGAAPFAAPVAETRMEGWEKYLRLLLTSQMRVAREVIRGLQDEGASGSIINIGSIASFRGWPGSSYYAAAKHGLVGLTRTMAIELLRYG